MAVQESVTHTYWNVLILSGYAFLLYSLLQFCTTESAVLETSVSIDNIASSSTVQSTAAGPAAGLLPPSTFLEGGISGGSGFSGGAEAASAAGTGGSAGAAKAASV
jgi:hypothetical protein